jgi:Zn-dependent protease with chaperone function
MKKIIILILLSFSALGFAEVIDRDFVPLRQGAGSYYPVVIQLPKGTEYKIISPDENWVEIEAEETSGFVAAPLLLPLQKQELSRSSMIFQRRDVKVAAMGITAGIKGFAGKYSEQFGGDKNFLQAYAEFTFPTKSYEIFRKETYRNVNIKKVRRKIKSVKISQNRTFTFSEEALGLGIASKIATIGLYRNQEWEEYINFVGMLLVEASDDYFQKYTFFILADDSINAYSCPGGIVFITLGMLKAISNEAELAFVLAHEIAHVTLKHGMLEAERRKEHLLADDLFAELDEELQELGRYEENETEKEMEQLTVGIYETVYKGRLEKYENEADEYAIHLLQRAAYPQEAVGSLLTRLTNYQKTSNNEHYTPSQIKSRLQNIQKYVRNEPSKKRDIIRNTRYENLKAMSWGK